VRCNVLITAGSRRVPLVRAFQLAVDRYAPGSAVVVADVNPLSPTVYVADRSYPVPLSTSPDYLDAIERICRIERIRLVVPTIDDELTLFGTQISRFGGLGAVVAVSPAETCAVCNDKLETCDRLNAAGVRAARTWLPGDVPADSGFPLFIKPRGGRGGVGAFPVRTARELDFFTDYVADPVVQEYLNGPEFTIDVLCDFEGRPISVVPRERVVIRAGVVDRGRTVRDSSLIQFGIACARALPFRGPINIQCRVVDGVPIAFEINPRFSGGIPLTIASGADFPGLLVQLAAGLDLTPAIGVFEDDLWMTSHESAVFVPAHGIGFSVDRDASRERVA